MWKFPPFSAIQARRPIVGYNAPRLAQGRIHSFVNVDVGVDARESLIGEHLSKRDRQSKITSTGRSPPECHFLLMRYRQTDRPRLRR